MASPDLSGLLACETTESMEAAAKALATKATAAGAGALKTSGVVAQLKAELADKGKSKSNQRAAALHALTALLTSFGAAGEAYFAPLLPDVIECLSDKFKPVQLAAAGFTEALTAVAYVHPNKKRPPSSLNANTPHVNTRFV
jgi:hypothetical protein